MRFVRLKAPAFGALRELDTGQTPLGGLVVVEGRNEAGKSTFFELLCVLLYGFYPASRDGYPYAPWGGRAAEASGWVRLGSGVEVEIRRRLLSTPRGVVLRGDQEEEIRNRTVPWGEHVPRAVFRQVFALTLAELTALEGQSWSAVQDRLLGAMGASDLRPARAVAQELQNDAGALWRPTRRGRQAVREIQEQIRELRLRRREVLEQDGRMREVSAERDQLAQELAEARREREGARVQLDRLQTLLPVRRRLRRIAELEERAGPPALLDGVPEEVGARLGELQERSAAVRARLRQLEEDRAEPAQAVQGTGPHDEGLLDRRAEVEARESEWAGTEPLRARGAVLLREIRDRERRVDEAVTSLLNRGADAAVRQAIRALPVSDLGSAVDDVQRAQQALDQLPEGAAAAAHARPSGSVVPWATMILVGLLLMVAGWGWRSPVLGVIGGLAVGTGIGLAVSWWHRQGDARRARSEAQGRHAHRERLRGELTSAQERLRQLLKPLGAHGSVPMAGPDLPLRIERLKEWIREEEDRREELEQLDSRIAETAGELRALADLLPDGEAPDDPGVLAHLLSRALGQAASRREAARAATRELARLDRGLEEARREEKALQEEVSALNERLLRLGEGEEALTEATARLAARARARQLREELERDHPTLEALQQRIQRAEEADESWAGDPEAEATIRARVLELDDRVEVHTRRLEALDKDLEFLGRRTRLDEIDGEIMELEERADGLRRQRDRLWVLSRIVQEAERSVREEHQPAVLREASTVLGELTGGRYDRILLTGRDGRDFRVRGAAAPDSLPVASPLSTGTREQVYLALRLAILDQLDRAGERLPLFLDEVLVNWDPERREAGLRLLAQRSKDRQCFFFTCHPDLAERLETLGACRLRLPDPTS